MPYVGHHPDEVCTHTACNCGESTVAATTYVVVTAEPRAYTYAPDAVPEQSPEEPREPPPWLSQKPRPPRDPVGRCRLGPRPAGRARMWSPYRIDPQSR